MRARRAGELAGAEQALEKAEELRPRDEPLARVLSGHGMLAARIKQKARSWYRKGVQRIQANEPREKPVDRFRAEAAALLGLSDHATPTTRKEQNTKERPKPQPPGSSPSPPVKN